MTKFFTVLLVIGLAAGHADAQPGATLPGDPAQLAATEAFLEQRLVEELAADGIVLSRLGVVLEIEVIESRALVSLLDPSTGRAVASTKLDVLPADRATAVATLTPVVANLVAQFTNRPPTDDTDGQRLERIEQAQRELLARAEEERRQRAHLAEAEEVYREEAIRFDREIVGFSGYHLGSGVVAGGVGYRWKASRGDAEVPLEGAEFYRAIDRPDLVARYHRRKRIAVVSLVASGAMLIGGGVLLAHKPHVEPDYSGCEPGDFICHLDATSSAEDEAADRAKPYATAGVVTVLASGAVMTLGFVYLMRPHPVSEREARRLGGEHNRKLRERLGLPGGGPPAEFDPGEVTWTPYVIPDGGGVALSGRF